MEREIALRRYADTVRRINAAIDARDARAHQALTKELDGLRLEALRAGAGFKDLTEMNGGLKAWPIFS